MRSLLLHRHCRGVAVMLVACALLVRMLVPSGFMIAPGATGLPTVIACPGQDPVAPMAPMAMAPMKMAPMKMAPMTMAPMTMAMPGMAGHDMHHQGGEHDRNADHPCAFAAANAAVDLTAAVHPIAPTMVAVFAPAQFHTFARPGLGLAAPPPPKTGPPILA